jgi:hypothetical protein
MKQILIVFSCLAVIHGTTFAEKPYGGVVDKHGKPTHDLLQLLTATNITTDGTLSDIIVKTRDWLTPKNSSNKMNPKIAQALGKIGTVNAVLPQHKKYDHIFIMCDGFENILLNLSFAWVLISQKELASTDIIFLPTTRQANPLKENSAALKKLIDQYRSVLPLKKGYPWKKFPRTETEFVQLLIAQLDIPKKLKLKLASATLPVASNSGLANLAHKIAYAFLTRFGSPGHCLFITGNPFIGYQDAMLHRTTVQMKRLLKDSDHFEVAGPAADSHTPARVYLDTIARWVYEEMVRIRLEQPIKGKIL